MIIPTLRHLQYLKPGLACKMSQMTATSEKAEESKSGSGFRSLFVTVFWALVIAFLLRVFVFQPFTIPSASMEPNLIEGDYIITSKYSVGYGRYAADPLPFPVSNGRLFASEPRRGDVIVFKPKGIKKHYIKRLVGLPGDKIQMIAGILYINDEPSTLQDSAAVMPEDAEFAMAKAKVETIPGESQHFIYDHITNNGADNTDVYIVPRGHYFMIGDNRDHSGDSRFTTFQGGIGFVPAENIIGKAEFILLSAREDFSLIRPWTWGELRRDRFFKGIQ